MQLSPEILEFVKIKRFYVFFEDGSWRACTERQWKEEQVYKLKPVLTGWFCLSDFDVKVLKTLIKNFQMSP